MQKGKLIGEGYTAEVFSWGDHEVIKLFRKEFPVQGIEKEYNISKKAQEFGLPVPKVEKMVELEGRTGIIYERIGGTPMMKRLFIMPWFIRNDANMMAEMHYNIHQNKVSDLPKLKEVLEWNILSTDAISEKYKNAIIDHLHKLPDGDVLCHNDFHPGNVIVDHSRSTILDWMTATSGNAAADVARTLLLLKDATLPPKTPLFARIMSKRVRSQFAAAYLKRYRLLSGINMEEINDWRLPIAAARLVEWIPEDEKNFILNMLNHSID